MRIFIAIFIAFLFLACSSKAPQGDQSSQTLKAKSAKTLQKDVRFTSRYTIQNSGQAPQNLDPFISQNANNLGYFPYKIKLDERRYLSSLFRTLREPLPSLNAKNQSAIFWGILGLKKGFDENGEARSKAWFNNIKENADIKSYGNIAKLGITTDIVSVRLAPSDEALFPSKLSAKQNNFDDLQASVLGAFAPIFVSHFSKDKNWAFVRTDGFWGWIKADNLMLLDDKDASDFFENKFGVFIKDDEKIQSSQSTFTSRIGGIFPYTKYDKNAFYFKGKIGNKFYDYKIDFGVGSHFLQVNDANLKSLANTLIGQEYGWGGMRNLRDCSLFVKDYFAVFGRYLPRNSQAQGSVGGKTEIFGSSEDRKNILKNKALLMTTLLVMPGHVMLYAGNGEVIHNVWGIRTQENGRSIIGKTAITDLEVGKGYENIKDNMLLLNRIKSLNVIIDPLKIALENAYNVRINSKVLFDDGYSLEYENKAHNANFSLQKNDNLIASMKSSAKKQNAKNVKKGKKNYKPSKNSKTLKSAKSLKNSKVAKSSKVAKNSKNSKKKIVKNSVKQKSSKSSENSENSAPVAQNTQKTQKLENSKPQSLNSENSVSIAQMISEPYALYAPLNAPRVDGGKLRAKAFFDHVYGENEAQVKANLVNINWLNKSLAFNSKNGAGKALERVSKELKANISKSTLNALSNAILEPNAHGTALRISSLANASPDELEAIIMIFEQNGFIWGGRWVVAQNDYFEYRPEYMMLERLQAY